MSEKYGFFPDNEYTTFDWAKYFGSFIGNGVFPNPSTNLQVIANDDMSVTVKIGKAWINGYFYSNEDTLILPIENADGVLKRKDNIVIRLDNSLNKITARVVKGIFASNPIAPTVSKTTDYYDLKIAEILINEGAVQITQANITDTRLDSTVCGIVTQTVETIDTEVLYAQLQDDMASFKTEEQAEFLAWFESVTIILDDNVAGNLLNEINRHKDNLQPHVQTFIHTKTGTTHNLTSSELPTGLFTARFKATDGFIEDDTFKINNVVYTAQSSRLESLNTDDFKSGAVVSIEVDTDGKKINFKLGGGMNETLPPQVTNFKTVIAINETATLSWTNPTDESYSRTIIVRKTDTYPTNINDGIKVYKGTASAVTDVGLINNVTYYYTAFSCNSKGQSQTMQSTNRVIATPLLSIRLGDMPVGTKIKHATLQTCTIAEHNHQGYPSNSTAILMTGDLFNNGLFMQMFTNSTDTKGYKDSLVRTYLLNTFYNSLSPVIKNRMLTVTVPCGRRTNVSITTYTVADKVFLPSVTELGFVGKTDGQGNLTATVADGYNIQYYATNGVGTTAHIGFWTRTIDRSGDCFSTCTSWGSLLGGSNAEEFKGVRPMMCLSSDTLISTQADTDGAYWIMQ